MREVYTLDSRRSICSSAASRQSVEHVITCGFRPGFVIRKAVDFLCQQVGTNGAWSDFATRSSGESTSWVTAHVLLRAGMELPKEVVDRAVTALVSEKYPVGGWGFSPRTPPDCDSTVHALGALLASCEKKETLTEMIDRGLSFILSHQQRDGGFSTYLSGASLAEYRRREDENDFSGWTQSHACVTAGVLELLNQMSAGSEAPALRATIFLLERQHPRGYWQSFWWRSPHFATARVIPLLASSSSPASRRAANLAVQWLLGSQRSEGFWTGALDSDVPCVLSTALCTEALVKIGCAPERAQCAVEWLVHAQLRDGSWPTDPCLQIPSVDQLSPEVYPDWRMGGVGVGACCRDRRGIYTAGAVIGALSTFLRGARRDL